MTLLLFIRVQVVLLAYDKVILVTEESKILSRIVSGTYKFRYKSNSLKLIYPSIQLKYEADILFQEVYDEHKYEDWLTLESAQQVLIDNGIWHSSSDQQLFALEKELEQIKINLFLSFTNPIQQLGHRSKLAETNKKYDKYYGIRHSLDHFTLEAFCDHAKNFYILSNSLFDSYGRKFITHQNYDHSAYQNISNIIAKDSISTKKFRKIARCDLWRNYWSAGRGNVFDKPSAELTDEQRALVIFTKMYESARESVESPPDPVFDDDDMFDGWLAYQHQKQDESKKENSSKNNSKMSNAQEMFIMANNKKQASSIHNMNSGKSKSVIESRNKAISKNQNLDASKLPDIQNEIRQQAQQKMRQRLKG